MNKMLFNKETAKVFIVSVLFSLFIPAISILLHELGHFIFAYLTGFTESKIHYQFLEKLPRTNVISYKARSLSLIGGPLFSILQVVISLFFICKGSKNSIFYSFGLFSQVQILRFIPNIEDSEEFRFSISQNIPGIIFWMISFLIFVFAVSYILIKIIRRKQFFELTGVFVGLILGFNSWMYVIGPILLP